MPPTVFVLPLHDRFNHDLLLHVNESRSFGHLHWTQTWFSRGRDVYLHSAAEYDQDVYLHSLLQSHPRITSRVEEADIIYAPFYYHRLRKHWLALTYAQRAQLVAAFRAEMQQWMALYPPSGSRKYLTTASSVCSCGDDSAQCHPWAAPGENTSLIQRHLMVLAWERPPFLVPGLAATIVTPYFVPLPGSWSPPAVGTPRKLLVLATCGLRQGNLCTRCGPCFREAAASTESDCQDGCRQIRPRLHETLKRWAEKVDDVGIMEAGTRRHTQNYSSYIEAMSDSVFCLQPSGDTLTRAAFYQAILFGCIPVVFREDDAFLGVLALSPRIPYRSLWAFVPEASALSDDFDIVRHLRRIPRAQIDAKQTLLRSVAPLLAFPLGTSARSDDGRRALEATLDAVWEAGRAG